MVFHAYSKRQFAQSDFDASGYHFATENELGDSFATLDCKRWGKRNLIAYFTLDNGEKIIVAAFPSQNYCGLMDIPMGAIVDIGFDMVIGSGKVFLEHIAWCPDEVDAREAAERELCGDPEDKQ